MPSQMALAEPLAGSMRQQTVSLVPATPPPVKVAQYSCKKGGKEREYTLQDLREMVITLLKGKVGGAKKVAGAAGFPQAYKTVARYRDAVVHNEALQRDTVEATLAARIAYVQDLEWKGKGNLDITSRRIFSEDELEYFARALKLYSDMGWPMDYQAIRLMLSEAAADMNRVDWKRGDAYVVSRSYVRKFVKSRPELRAYKAGHIDPVRAKKATCQVPRHCALLHDCACSCACPCLLGSRDLLQSRTLCRDLCT